MSTATLLSRRLLSHLHEPEQTASPLEDGGGRLLHWHYNQFDDHNFQIHGHTLIYLFILFAVVLFATLLLLYARWFLRLRRPTSTAQITTLPISHTCPSTPKGLDFTAINSLPITLYVEGDGEPENAECCICLGVFDEGDKVKVLPGCEHRYHSICVDTWLIGHSNCPLCRLPVQVHMDPV